MHNKLMRHTWLVIAGSALLALGACAGTGPEKTVGQSIDDTVLTAKVKTALIEDKTVKALDVNVETNMGVVQLAGFADSREQIERAGEVARGVEGVKSVKNDLRLKGD
ncbi:MAG: BON domain-containing protein [Steroidobacteraceae bacterium]|nr:BON domain-containing protein [Steroidobacteraceae bacterium]MCW5572103.1 BON domain-containing protein [Steroidobacteraceae bacterium]